MAFFVHGHDYSRRAIYTVYTTNDKNLEGGQPMAFLNFMS
jgi:hypothetical protein